MRVRSDKALIYSQHSEDSDEDDLYLDCPMDADGDDSSALSWTGARSAMAESPNQSVIELPIDAKRPVAGGPPKSLDLVTSIDGMFRILDLVSEQGSGGLGKDVS